MAFTPVCAIAAKTQKVVTAVANTNRFIALLMILSTQLTAEKSEILRRAPKNQIKGDKLVQIGGIMREKKDKEMAVAE